GLREFPDLAGNSESLQCAGDFFRAGMHPRRLAAGVPVGEPFIRGRLVDQQAGRAEQELGEGGRRLITVDYVAIRSEPELKHPALRVVALIYDIGHGAGRLAGRPGQLVKHVPVPPAGGSWTAVGASHDSSLRAVTLQS